MIDLNVFTDEPADVYHAKRGAAGNDPQTLRIDYRIGYNDYRSEWVCPEHGGWARKKFERWWFERSNDPAPDSAVQAVRLAEVGSLSIPRSITVRKVAGERYDRIIKHTLPPDKPPGHKCDSCHLGVPSADGLVTCKRGLLTVSTCSLFELVESPQPTNVCGDCFNFSNGFCCHRQDDGYKEQTPACDDFTEVDDVPF